MCDYVVHLHRIVRGFVIICVCVLVLLEKVTFIDFEYVAFNYQAFDIGNHFCEFAGKLMHPVGQGTCSDQCIIHICIIINVLCGNFVKRCKTATKANLVH